MQLMSFVLLVHLMFYLHHALFKFLDYLIFVQYQVIQSSPNYIFVVFSILP
jgi:hypothetical protein